MKKLILSGLLFIGVSACHKDSPAPSVVNSTPQKVVPFDSIQQMVVDMDISAGGNCPNCIVSGYYKLHGKTTGFAGYYGVLISGDENTALDTITIKSGDTLIMGITLSTLNNPHDGFNSIDGNYNYPFIDTIICGYKKH